MTDTDSETTPDQGWSRRQVLAASAAAFIAATIAAVAGPAPKAIASTNGQVPANQLTMVPGSSGSVPLDINTAAAWLAMVAACASSTGVTMVVTSPDGGYRDLAMQQNLIDNPEGPVGIAPLGQSSHGWGTAVDIWNRQYPWLVANASTYGFTQTFSNEPWHWQYNGDAYTPPTTPQGVTTMVVAFKVIFDQPGHAKHGTRAIVTPSEIGTARFFRELGADTPTQTMADKYITAANGGNALQDFHLSGQEYLIMQGMSSS
ncbi:D-alanyl-D-alanine carboxypeptidase family protein [Amnibacterium flavum]|uniref:M15 family metallopeptidase n=1 Tax=Amnibacterium flavum TaxID=2173173 RepID=UPI001403A811|nr:M15 family metallopeptidase [Amnibacterium flavum]